MGKFLREARRSIVVDTMHNYNAGAVANPLPGYDDVHSVSDLVKVLRRVRHGDFRLCYKPSAAMSMDGQKDALIAEFDAVARLAWEVRNLTFAIDEVWNYCRSAWMPNPLRVMALAWGHRGLRVLYTAQRPQLVPPNLRDNTTQWYIFQLQPGSLALESLRGKVADEALGRVPKLPKYWHVHSDDREEWQVVKPSR